MKRPILTVPNQTLREKSAPIDLKMDRKLLEKMVKDLSDTLVKKEDPKGVGLAEPQIGKNFRMFASYLPDSLNSENSGRDHDEEEPSELKIFINPEIVAHSKDMTFGPDPEDPLLEGCLSIPGIYGPVPRFEWVTVSYYTPELVKTEEKLRGFYARVVQHEYDHLEGILFTDYTLKLDLPIYEYQHKKLVEVDSSFRKGILMSNQPLQILLAGTPNTTVMVGEALLEAGHTISTVLSPFPKPIGRKKVVTTSDLEQWARTKDIPVVNVNRESFQNTAFLDQLPVVDLLVVADFGYLVPGWLLEYPKYGGLNIHPSLLPRWRGATPVPFTLLFGDEKTGVTVIKMNEQFDKGGIVEQKDVDLYPDDTTPILLSRAFAVGAELLAEILPAYISGLLKPIPQHSTSPTPLTQKFSKDDGFVPLVALQTVMEGKKSPEPAPLLAHYSLETNAVGIDRMVRALSPWPGVWTVGADGKRIKILKTALNDKHLLEVRESQLEGKGVQQGLVGVIATSA